MTHEQYQEAIIKYLGLSREETATFYLVSPWIRCLERRRIRDLMDNGADLNFMGTKDKDPLPGDRV